MGALRISGIYAIINILDNKVYVGKSININLRWWQHKNAILKNSKNCNRYLKNAVNKYGINNFKIEVLEEISEIDDNYFKKRELFWMDYLNSYDKNFGYNLRRDSDTKMIVHEDTRRLKSIQSIGILNPNYGNYWSNEAKIKMSILKKEQYKLGITYYNPIYNKIGINIKRRLWEENPELKKLMAKRVSNKKSKYNILKIDKSTLEILEEFETFMSLKEKYPDVGKTVIFSVCNGNKKSYKGYIWRYRDKKTNKIINPIKKYKN